jgi:hypothetical protein
VNRHRSSDDPRNLGGDLAGPGGPFDRHAVVFDTSNAVLLGEMDAAVMHNGSDGQDFITLLLQGRVNQSKDRARVLYIMDEDGAAALTTEIESLIVRAPEWRDRYEAARAERIRALRGMGAW